MFMFVTGKTLDSPEKGNVDKMSKKCPKNVQKLSRGAENTIFGHVLDNFCLFGRCFCLVTLSNVRPLQVYGRLTFIQCRYWEELHSLSIRFPDPSPVLAKNRAPMGAEILSSTGAGVWRKAPKAFPDSSSVLDQFQYCSGNV